jgi:hypothetical protein
MVHAVRGVRDGATGAATASMKTTPVNRSLGPGLVSTDFESWSHHHLDRFTISHCLIPVRAAPCIIVSPSKKARRHAA